MKKPTIVGCLVVAAQILGIAAGFRKPWQGGMAGVELPELRVLTLASLADA
jgi:hypothetical protein